MNGKGRGCNMIFNLSLRDIIIQNKNFLFFVFFLSVAVRALVFVGYLSKNENYWQVDSQTYHLVAQQVAQGNGISSADGSPHFYRLPGYPLWLGFFYHLFGVDTKNVLWPQIIIASVIPVLIFLLSLVLFPGMVMVARGAALWASLHLGLVLYAGFFMTESLFIFLLLLFFIFFFSSFHLFFSVQAKTKYLLIAGVFLGLASMFRPVGHYLIILSCFLLLFSRGSWFCKVKNVLVLAGGWAGVVSFWLIRNVILTGYLFFHTLPGGHFLYLSAARVAMHAQHCSYQEARQHLYQEVHELLAEKERSLGRPLLEIESCKIHESLAVSYFKQYPLIAVKNWCVDIFRTMFSLYSSELLFIESGRQSIDYFKKDRPWLDMFIRYLMPQTDFLLLKIIIWFEIVTFLGLLFGFIGLIGLSWFGRRRQKNEMFDVLGKCLPFMMLFTVIALAGGYARMRLPIEPFIMILAFSFWIKVFTYESTD